MIKERVDSQSYYLPQSDDVFQNYLSEIRRLPLLSHEEVVSLAQQIEVGKSASGRLENGEFEESEHEELLNNFNLGQAARQKLIASNTPLVVKISKRYFNSGFPPEDVIQEGNIGLIKAVDKFDPKRGYRFSTYATFWIRKEITRSLAQKERMIRMPVLVYEAQRKVYAVQNQLIAGLGRQPTISELSHELGFDEEEVEELLSIQNVLSLEDPINNPLFSDITIESSVSDEATDQSGLLPGNNDSRKLETILSCLPYPEAKALTLHFGLFGSDAISIHKIALSFGTTESKIKQLIQSALERLRHPRRQDRLLKLFQD